MVAVACFLPGWAKNLSAPPRIYKTARHHASDFCNLHIYLRQVYNTSQSFLIPAISNLYSMHHRCSARCKWLFHQINSRSPPKIMDFCIKFEFSIFDHSFSYCSYKNFYNNFSYARGTRWRSRLRHCAASRKVAGSIPDGVIGIFH